MTKKICIVDYKLGNLFSVNQALKNIGHEVVISSKPQDIQSCHAVVLPGVGAFGEGMKNLDDLNLIQPIIDAIGDGKPFLGICLGLQLLFSESEEFGFTKGLGIINGKVKRFNNVNRDGELRKVPQIAWNQILMHNGKSWDNTVLQNINPGTYMYFVHSFFVDPSEAVGLSITDYDGQYYVSSVLKENVFACQFHPEKSADEGLKIYRNWTELNNLL